MKNLRAFWNDDSGVTAIEYALICSVISITIITAATSVGTKLSTIFDTVATAL
jgi:pilus assembly protein Flp/PilA